MQCNAIAFHPASPTLSMSHGPPPTAPPTGVVPMEDVPTAPNGVSRLVFGSLEAAMRAEGASAANAHQQQAQAQTQPTTHIVQTNQPVSFNQRSALITHKNGSVGDDAAQSRVRHTDTTHPQHPTRSHCSHPPFTLSPFYMRVLCVSVCVSLSP